MRHPNKPLPITKSFFLSKLLLMGLAPKKRGPELALIYIDTLSMIGTVYDLGNSRIRYTHCIKTNTFKVLFEDETVYPESYPCYKTLLARIIQHINVPKVYKEQLEYLRKNINQAVIQSNGVGYES